jgi:hypothetical protein
MKQERQFEGDHRQHAISLTSSCKQDPYHAGHYAVEMLRGMQEEDANGHPLMISFLKHFTACSYLHHPPTTVPRCFLGALC